MTNKYPICCILPLLLLFCSPLISAEILHQRLQAELHPESGRLRVEAEISLPQTVAPEFLLHRGLNPHSATPGVILEERGQIEGPAPLTAYRIRLPEGVNRFTLGYEGRISHSLTRLKESPGRSRQQLAGTVSAEGVHLDATTAWYPRFPDRLQTFDLKVDLPQGWLAVSQGQGPESQSGEGRQRVRWRATSPQDAIYLIAAPFRLYQRRLGDIDAQVFLRRDDPALANRYLDASETYLRLFQQLLGAYPYAKFALVENFWQTGYGMPSFTLLGSRVIRLPFILHSSYPHEILHNWWGNGVYVDYAQGNWSEGLTSYLADHLLAERAGRGSDHRRSALQRYGDFVRDANDFPLREFRGRHSTASQAVGYDKSLMLFHMLRRQLGDERFIDGLRRFYRQHRFRQAGFSQLQTAFEAAGGRPLEGFFRQWTERTGAPGLALEQVELVPTPRGYSLRGRLRQTQKAPPYRLQVPLAIQLENGRHRIEQLLMTERLQSFAIDLSVKPDSLTVDPWFDLFRSLDRTEIPPSLSQFFGAERVQILLPSEADTELLEGYRRLAEAWARDYQAADIRLDSEVEGPAGDRPVLILGWENRFTPRFFDALSNYPLQRDGKQLSLWDRAFERQGNSFVLTHRPGDSPQIRLWIGTRSAASLPGLTRKLPHYGKYSALVFAGDRAENRLKRQWPVSGSPLQVSFGANPVSLPPQPAPLVEE